MQRKIILNLMLFFLAINAVLSKDNLKAEYFISINQLTHNKNDFSFSDTTSNSLIGKWVGNPIIYQNKEFSVLFNADNTFNLVEYNTETKKRKSLTGTQKRGDGTIVELQLKYTLVSNEPTYNLILTPLIGGVELDKKMYAKYTLMSNTTMKLMLLFDESSTASSAEEIILRKENQ